MPHFSLRGLGIALITPFNLDKTIDYNALDSLIDKLIRAGVNYIVVLGTTGESATLSATERAELLNFVARKVDGIVPLVLGLGGNCTDALVEELHLHDLSPFSAILSVVPFYNKPSQEGIYQHYMTLADNSPIPIVLYNVPGRTGVNMTSETTLRLAHNHKNIIGIKEASGNMQQVEEIIRNKPDGFEVVSGDDALAFPFICMGASGVISVMGNAYPKLFGRLVNFALEGNLEGARELQRKFDTMYRLLFVDGNPAGIKALLNDMGIAENILRLPLVPCSAKTYDLLHQASEAINDD